MNSKIKISMIMLGIGVGSISPLMASEPFLPAGFEDIFNAKQNAIYDILFDDESLGSIGIEYDQHEAKLLSPRVIVDRLTAPDMPALNISRQALLSQLSSPLPRVNKAGFAKQKIVVYLDESNTTLQLLFPAALFNNDSKKAARKYIPFKNNSGFVHSHNINYLDDTYGNSLSVYSTETLNLTGSSYVKGTWSYADTINFELDELAFYLEENSNRFKLGRQRLHDNLSGSTPSMAYSFYNAMSFDGISLGYMTDNYIAPGTGAASPVTLYMPMAGTVEIYRNGRLLDIQQLSAGLQTLDTQSWPTGGYDVQLVTKLTNGSREEKTQPFFKRTGTFHSGDIEYLLQLGRYDPRRDDIKLRTNSKSCSQCNSDTFNTARDNNLASASLAYTTESALSAGAGALLDNTQLYANTSLDIPVNSWIAERLFADGIYGRDGSSGYQIGLMKNLASVGLNLSYRDNRYRGDKKNYRHFGIVPAYDFNYLQLGLNTFLPWNVGLGVNYGLNTVYQDYGHSNKSQFNTWDINLSRDFTLSDMLNMRIDLGYHRGVSETSYAKNSYSITEDRLFAQMTLGMHERSYNHSQSLYLRARSGDDGLQNNTYAANYALNLDNPDFDRSGKYTVTADMAHGPQKENNAGASITVDNALGYTSAGIAKSFGDAKYQQQYLSQRSGFAIGADGAAWGRMDNDAALIVDATDLPKDQYFEIRNRSSAPTIVKGGQKTTLSMQPYQKIAPEAEQVFSDKTDAFYNLKTQSTSTWAKPGQVYQVKLSATQNQTVTGRLYSDGQPLSNARVVGGNSMSDEDGLFVADFTLQTNEHLTSLTVKKEGQDFTCPLLQQNIKVTKGIMQIREVNCEIQ
ncbi:TcfC E-set like domain-containing protein [Intestinirhabdus alba]|jgi:outer membrane usher protein FimD/PapC|uniref:CFA/I fimbrial subunit C n=1 Tax=Intestinirhabdus alba TaxID=2899544 RepID=A0A6L6IJ16_9ENTR|nr:TcfC E-set like domain-containing protein [Intestinirhabdus alba]MTH45586.1 CFA/I fimbrial subunit C [Intestinirhabdus alba]